MQFANDDAATDPPGVHPALLSPEDLELGNGVRELEELD